MELNYGHLRYFWAVARDGNLTRAAANLHVSQSAVSVQIRLLEETLGQRLFERAGRTLVLTEAGKIVLDHAETIFELGKQVVATLAGARQAKRVLRVGALATLSRNFQLMFLRPLLGREDVEIVLRSGSFRELLPSLEAHRLDVLLSNTVPARDAATTWVAHTLAAQPITLVGHPSRRRRGQGLAQILASQPLILPTSEGNVRSQFDDLVHRLEVTPRIVAEVDDMAMIRLLARENMGLAVVPAIVVRDELAAKTLVKFGELRGLKETFYAITATRRFPNPLARELIRANQALAAAKVRTTSPGKAP